MNRRRQRGSKQNPAIKTTTLQQGASQPQAPQVVAPQVVAPTSHSPRWLGAGKWIIGATVTGVGFVLAVAGSPGPPWPTGPSIKASNLDRLPPLSVPFDVQNKSILFKTHVRSIACMLPSYFVTNSGSAEIAEAAVLVPFDVNLPRDSTIPFKCPLDISIYKTTPFKLYFCIQYDAPFYEFWKAVRSTSLALSTGTTTIGPQA